MRHFERWFLPSHSRSPEVSRNYVENGRNRNIEMFRHATHRGRIHLDSEVPQSCESE